MDWVILGLALFGATCVVHVGIGWWADAYLSAVRDGAHKDD